MFDAPPDPATGLRRQTSRRGFRTRAEADAFLRAALTAVEDGTFTPPNRATLREYLEEWLEGQRKRPTTMADYRQVVHGYVLPRIGGLRLQALRPEDLDRLYRTLERNGRRLGPCRVAGITCDDHGCAPERHPGLSMTTVRNVHGVVHRALEDAARRGYVARNVASLANPPTARQARSADPRERAWDAATLADFLDHVRHERLAPALRLLATTGARRGEVLGLRWSDVDLGRRTALLGAQTLTVVAGELVWQLHGKTPASTREVSLDPRTCETLDAHRRRQEHERRRAGPAWTGDPHGPLVFCDPHGGPVRPDSFSRTFARLVREAGLPQIGVHGLRHTYATAALRSGVTPDVLSRRLGHADVGITLGIYAHVRPIDDRHAADRVAAAIDELEPEAPP